MRHSRDGNAEQVGHTQSTVGQDDAEGNSNAQSEKVPTAAKAVEFDIHRFRHALLEDFHEDPHAKHVHLAREPTPRLASEGGLPGTPGKFEAFGLWRLCFPPCLVRPGMYVY